LEQGRFGFGCGLGTGATLQVLSRLRRDVGFSLRPGLGWAFCGLHEVFWGLGGGSGLWWFMVEGILYWKFRMCGFVRECLFVWNTGYTWV